MHTLNDLSEILKKDWNQDFQIKSWIQSHLEKEEALHVLLAQIWQDAKYFHVFLDYAEISLKKWNFIHPKILDTIAYIFSNFRLLAPHNVQINSFLLHEYTSLLESKQILDFIVEKTNPSSLDNELQYRLLKYFLNHFHKNLLLKEKKDFFIEMLEDFAKKSPERANEVLGLSIESIFYIFEYTLSEGYRLFFEISKSGWRFVSVSDREIAYIRWLGEQTITDELVKMDEKLFMDFVDRFYDGYLTNSLNLLPLTEQDILSKEKVFYLSLVSKKMLFNSEDTDDFIAYILGNISQKKDTIIVENKVYDFKNFLSFIKENDISIFSKKYLLQIISLVDSNESQSWAFIDYIERFFDVFILKDIELIKDILQNITYKNITLKRKMNTFIILQLAQFYSIEQFVEIAEKYDIVQQSSQIEKLQKIVLNFHWLKLHKKSYHFLERYLVFLYTKMETLTNKHEIKKYFSTRSGKTKYILMRTCKKYKLEDMKDYINKEYREQCYFASHFPLAFVHFVRRLLESK